MTKGYEQFLVLLCFQNQSAANASSVGKGLTKGQGKIVKIKTFNSRIFFLDHLIEGQGQLDLCKRFI